MSRAGLLLLIGLPLIGGRLAVAEPEAGLATGDDRSGLSFKRLYFRAGAAAIAPQVSSREVELSGVEGPASLALRDGAIAGSGADVENRTVPAVIVGYTLPWLGERLSLETVLGAPFVVKLTATGTLARESLAPEALGIPTGVMALGPELGETRGAPLVGTLTYAIRDRSAAVVPYLGLGASVLFTYGSEITNPILTEVRQPDMRVSPAAGAVIQGGLDLAIYRRLRARLDVKYIAGMLARAEVTGLAVRTPGLPVLDAVDAGTARMSLWLNPLIVQLGLGVDL